MSWEFAPELDAGQRAALSAGKNLVYVALPAAWSATPLFEQLDLGADPGLRLLVIVPEIGDALDVEQQLESLEKHGPIHPATGISRTCRILGTGTLRTLVATPDDTIQLLTRSCLKLADLRTLALFWPESVLGPRDETTLDTILAEAKEAQRLIITSDPKAITDFLERQAWRAQTVAACPAATETETRVRYALVTPDRRAWTIRAALDVLDPASVLLWEPNPKLSGRWSEFSDLPNTRVASDPGDKPVDLAVATDLPSSQALAALALVASQVLVIVRPGQYHYLRKIAAESKALRLPSEADRARKRGFRLRRMVREQLEKGVATSLAEVEPLLDEYDPALIAAAALALNERPTEEPGTHPAAAWVRIYVNAGQRDKIRTGDLVGALLNAVGLAKSSIGKINLRDTFSLIEVHPDAVEQAIGGLTGITVRGRRLSARLDRR